MRFKSNPPYLVLRLTIVLIGIATNTLSCRSDAVTHQLQEGDILFQNLNCGALCDAIEAVTHGVNNRDFSHCAMVVNVNDTLRVIEAIGAEVQLNSLEDFFRRSGDTITIQNINIGRFKTDFRPLIENAVNYAMQQIGQPYDNEFLLNNGKWYCSELIHESFKIANNGNNVFTLEPMTFKEPEGNVYFTAWVDYFQNLGYEIPEGKAGLNPGSISRSEKIDIIPTSSFDEIVQN